MQHPVPQLKIMSWNDNPDDTTAAAGQEGSIKTGLASWIGSHAIELGVAAVVVNRPDKSRDCLLASAQMRQGNGDFISDFRRQDRDEAQSEFILGSTRRNINGAGRLIVQHFCTIEFDEKRSAP